MEKREPPDDVAPDRFVTVATYNWLRNRFEQLDAGFHELKSGLVGSTMFPGGKIGAIEKQISDLKTVIANLPEAYEQQRNAKLWRGWRARVITIASAVLTALIITGLTIWIYGNVQQASDLQHLTK